MKTLENKISRKGAKTQRIYKMTENEISKIIINCSIDIHKELGLLLNFGEALLKDGIQRIVNDL